MIQVLAPCAGRVIAMAEVDDPIFAAQTVGPGVGIEPPAGRTEVLSPADGTLLSLRPHAFIVLAGGSVGILVHVGINTVNLDGEGFELLAEQGQSVTAGTPIVAWDPAALTDPEIRSTVIVAVMDHAPDSLDVDAVGADVSSGEAIFSVAT